MQTLIEMLQAGGSGKTSGEILHAMDQIAFQADLLALMDQLQILSAPADLLQTAPADLHAEMRISR